MKKTIIISFAVLLTISVSAQTIKKYSGQMSKPEWISELFEEGTPYDINGFYSYYEDERECRIIHSDFFICYKASEVLLGVDKYEVRGSFSYGKRVGKWEMKAKLRNGKYAQDYLYQFSYRDGVLNGPFRFVFSGFEIIGKFSNGIIAGKVIIKQYWGKNYIQLEGLVNDKGNPHGVWTEKEISEKAIPKDITRLYFDGNLVYRKEKDLSSGNIVYTYSVSDEIRVPADTAKISDTIIKGKEYVKVGTLICAKDTNIDLYRLATRFEYDRGNEDLCVLYGVILEDCPMIRKIYHSISNWRTRLDSHAYAALVEREQEEKQRRKEEQIRAERRLKEEEERRRREEEYRQKREEEERLNEEIKVAYEKNYVYYDFCWGHNASSIFEKLYREIGLDSIESMLDSISHYEYENYTIEELYSKNPHYMSEWGTTKKKKLKKVFKTYDSYLQCKKEGIICLNREIERYRNPVLKIMGY